ncbi:ribosomal L7Ae/L30e/S12e/Gadd45 family protein [Mitsuokella sp.]|uniref:ribosomal L7Ae/L30e/S12e/Gadd45 family protein n=1 Tax=Mitsuokella TaxID=52225 RepID=UPI0029DF300D|nr:ribosomal L7Ae/L30e/S12e/Gadd45 family protein [Mitsuokella sp.]MDD6383768.1 ribosomal L7Ae/L30e/S12e/Gadd45 family protein [Selenomonadaceae bacterium]MDY4474922.1 ribosomal L7Ae/L30e/S12e/Gadd45 family protein [Mitsuokella sp.]
MTLDTLKSANRVIGIKQVSKAVKRESAACVFIADDADERVTAPLILLCEEQGVAVEHAETMQVLGKACGIEVGAAAAAVLKQSIC